MRLNASRVSRRSFVKAAVFSSTAASLAWRDSTVTAAKGGIFKNLGTGHIGVAGDQAKTLAYAVRFGFRGVNAQASDLQKMSETERERLLADMKQNRIAWGSADLGVQFRAGEEEFRKGLAELPERMGLLSRLGVRRVSTWITPGHDSLTYRKNFEQHRIRLTDIAKTLEKHELRLGLEFVGPKTSRNRSRFHFIHSLEELQELIEAIGFRNVGIVLDSYHWFTSGGTTAGIESLAGRDIVDVHVNDARQGLAIEDLPDGKRALPCTTGVIDMKAFINSLARTGYDGPVTCEPFDQELRDMDDQTAVQQTADALDRVFSLLD